MFALYEFMSLQQLTTQPSFYLRFSGDWMNHPDPDPCDFYLLLVWHFQCKNMCVEKSSWICGGLMFSVLMSCRHPWLRTFTWVSATGRVIEEGNREGQIEIVSIKLHLLSVCVLVSRLWTALRDINLGKGQTSASHTGSRVAPHWCSKQVQD